MKKPRIPLLVLGLVLAAAFAAPAGAQKLDAVHSADFAARTAVQTIYHNLITNGYEWRWIRDEKMPEILIRSVSAIKREAASMDKKLILNTFIPTYISAFFDEIDKLNAEHQTECIDVTFVVQTLIPFFRECQTQLSGVGTLTEIVVPVLKTEFSFRICQTLQVCQETLSDKYLIVFGERIDADQFYRVCVGENY
jgi:phosphoribosylformylglycinamidine (FGAM) synthase PurS component